MKYIYLGGPIYGLTFEEANAWRSEAVEFFKPHVALNPLRNINGKPAYGTEVPMPVKFKRDHTDIQTSSGLFFNFTQQSTGTICEIAWSFLLKKPTVVVTEDNRLLDDPKMAFLRQCIMMNPYALIVHHFQDGLAIMKEWMDD